MTELIQRFEQSVIYIVLAIVWAASVLSPDIAVNESAVTELTIIVVAVLAGIAKIGDVWHWLAVNRNFRDDFNSGVDYIEEKTGYDVPAVVEVIGGNLAEDIDNQLSNAPKAMG